MDAPNALKFVPPGGYRACANCAAAKAKCIQPDEGGRCERFGCTTAMAILVSWSLLTFLSRCGRLDKECHINPRAKKRRRQTDAR